MAIKYDPAHRIYASNSTATFSVKWPAVRRRLSDAAAPGLSQADGNDAADAIADLLFRKIEESRDALKADMISMRKEIVARDNMFIAIAAMAAVILIWKNCFFAK